MYWHMRIHDQSGKFKCKYCDIILKRKNLLRRHLMDMHGQEESSDDEDSEDWDFEESEDEGLEDKIDEGQVDSGWLAGTDSASIIQKAKQPFQCQLCERIFRLGKYLTYHLKRKHGNNEFKCEKCNRTFKYLNNLKRHERVDHAEICGKYLFAGQQRIQSMCCNLCPKEFTRKDFLVKHLSTHSPSKDLFPCESCEKVFYRKDNLQAHIRSFHTQPEAYYSCSLCDKKFKKSNRKRHFLLVHNI